MRTPPLSLALGALAGAMVLTSLAAQSTSTAPKDYVLFVGSNFTVGLDGATYPVVDAGNRTMVVQRGDTRKEYVLSALKDVRIRRGLKLSNLQASVGKLEVSMSSDYANAEEAEAVMNSIGISMAEDIKRDNAWGKLVEADMMRMAAGSSQGGGSGRATSIAAAEKVQEDAMKGYLQAEQDRTRKSVFFRQIESSTGSAPVNLGDEVEITPELTTTAVELSVSGQTSRSKAVAAQLSSAVATGPTAPAAVVDRGEGDSDHLDIQFEVSSPQSIDGVYAVVTTEYTPKNANTISRRVLTKAIGHIDATPKKIKLYQTAFPPGFHLRTYLINLYADGQEIATNLSDTKMTMTRDEAYQYMVVEYLASHRGKTAPPAALLMTPAKEFASKLAGQDAKKPLYVRVDSEGNMIGASLNAKSDVAPPGSLSAALTELKFIPALDNGKPVSGRAKVVLADFVQ